MGTVTELIQSNKTFHIMKIKPKAIVNKQNTKSGSYG